MKAIQYTAFGDSGVLKLNEVNKPQIKDDEVLVKAEATTVNPLEIKIRSGSMQKMMPVELPYVPGSDVSGIVEAVGNKVTRVKIGDRVVGTTSGGTYAEYVAVKEELTELIPSSISFNDAAALAVPVNTSYTLLNEAAQLKSGEKILIHGAAGAVGSVMVQLAKIMGAYVVATASGDGVAKVKALGADEVIDYKKQDFTTLVKDIDVVADLVGGETQAKSFSVLKRGGKLLSIVMPPSAELAEKHGVTAQFVFSKPSHTKLEAGLKLAQGGKLQAGIAKILKLADAANAQDLVSSGGVNGKVILE
jgi:NADPH:quinone reductase-like Zn-dependent oxidoreductase